jgi:signal transduction histidine kinase
MFNLILFYSNLFGNLMLLIFIAQLLPCRYSIKKTYAFAPVFALISMVKFLFDFPSTAFQATGYLASVLMLIILAFLFQGAIWKKTAVFIYFAMLIMLADALAGTIASYSYGGFGWLAVRDIYHTAIHTVLFTITVLLAGSASVLILRMIVLRKFQPFYFLFFILPLSQLLIIHSYVYSFHIAIFFLSVVLCVITDLVLLVYTISQEKKTALEEELREARHVMELEQSHYAAVEQHREELTKIRHDFNNQLSVISQLFQSGEGTTAHEMIAALTAEIIKTKENPYCAIPVVNAVLTEKARDCALAEIGFEVELDMPPAISVEKLHLCSIFSNLLDNAITACRQAGNAKPFIRLSSLADGDYLFIKAVNPSGKPDRTAAPGRGYGTRILSDLAARYGGDYRTDYKDGLFTAVVSLLAVEVV